MLCFESHSVSNRSHHFDLQSVCCRGDGNCMACGRAESIAERYTHHSFIPPTNVNNCDAPVSGRNWVTVLMYAPYLLQMSSLESQQNLANDFRHRFGVDVSSRSAVGRWSLGFSNGFNNWIWTYFFLRKVYFTEGPYGPEGPIKDWENMVGVKGINLATRTSYYDMMRLKLMK